MAPVSSDLTSLEKVLKVDVVKNLKLGIAFINKDNLYDCIIINYYKFLQGHKIELGNLLSWFCNVYLPSEFDVSDIRANELDGNKTIGKIRFLLPEIESVVHQYLMYVKYGEVNRDLFEMETGSFKFNDIPSKVNDKYAYASSDDIKNELYCLFSDQSGLSYISRFKEQYDTLFKLILTEKVNISEFLPYQLNRINWLMDRRTIIKDEQGWLSFNKNRVNLLADYYSNDVICIHYLNNQLKSELDKMVLNGDFKIESTLFSKPECNYINYYLNKTTYSNSLDLRNKYVHGKNTSTLEEQNRDYIKILKIMLLVIVKINEEFILSSDIHENYLVLD
ncbi:hypothetical protein [Limosilactobacillus equigenerosi]|uniref:hypothetical protein n=1 Tax=Limosilactobacillus equigenerosi TaxID=417373 RepID=UPI000705107B|nr:hypothetical protein [Limosilactobacillus equigenerosi]